MRLATVQYPLGIRMAIASERGIDYERIGNTTTGTGVGYQHRDEGVDSVEYHR